MKQLSKKIISLILIIAMIFCNTITNFAIDDLTLGEKKFVDSISAEGEAGENLFVATNSDLDILYDNANEEENLDDEDQNSNDTATASEIENEAEQNENNNEVKTIIEDENDTVSTPSDMIDIESNTSMSDDIEDENDNVSTPSDIDNTIASVNQIDNHIENIATNSDIEINLIEVASKSNIKIATDSVLFGDKATTSNIKKYRNGLFKENIVFPIPQKFDDDLFGSSPLPAAYDSRTVKNPANDSMSIIPPLKDQGQHSTCWAFATMGLVETSLRKQGLVKTEEESDLSELALAYFSYNLENITNNSNYLDTPGLEGNDYSEIIDPTEDFDSFGGSVLYASLLGSAYMGMVREDADPSLEYKPNEVFPSSLDGNLAFKNNSYVIKNAIFLNKYDRNSVKQAIMDYGAVSISFLGDGDLTTLFYDNVINGEHYLFPSGDPDSSNHAIIVVGWDDNVPASNFRNLLKGTAPINNGAWICKNSWGDYEFGNNGYFYMSYDEPSIDEDMYAIEAMKADTYKYNYHYDTTTSGSARGWNLPPSYNYVYSNVFKVHDDVTLDAVNFAIQSANVVMDILIYKKDSAMSQPNDGTLALKQTNVSLTYPGVYTIKLDQKIELAKDSYYSIVLRPQSSDENKFYLFTDMNRVMQVQKQDSAGNTTVVDALQTFSRSTPGQSFMGSNLDDEYYWSDPNYGNTDGFGENYRIRGLANPIQTAPAPASGIDYVLNPGWYSSTTLSQSLAAGDIENIEIRTYGVDSEPDSSYTSYDIPDSSVNSDNKLLKVYHKANEKDIIIYAPKLDSVNKIVTIKMAENASFLFSGDGTSPIVPSGHPIVTNGFTSLKTIVGLEKLNTESVTNMQAMFANCRALESFDLSNFDTSNVTDMSFMFYHALKNVTDLDLSSFNTSNVTTFAQMFNDIDAKHIDVTSFNTSSATNMYMMFCNFGAPHLESIDLSQFDTSNVTDMTHMISAPNVTSIDVSSFNTSNVTSLEGLFWNMSKLTSIDVSNFDVSNARNIKYMFWGCSGITNLDLSSFDTSIANNLENMFENCSNLEKIVVSDSFTIKSGANSSNMFAGCTKLKGPYTDFDPSIIDGTYARIDTPTTPGYFTSDTAPIVYTINYDAKGGSITGDTSFTKTKGTPITTDLATPTKTGYNFGGWYVDDDTFNTPYNKANDDIFVSGTYTYTIYAKWTAHEYSINYNLGGVSATAPATITKTYGQALAANTLKSPTNIPTGYTFVAWYKESTYVNEWTGAADDDLTTGTTTQTIYARWKAKITYNQNGHGTAPAAVDVYLNDTTPLPSINNVTGYTFDTTNSWYDDSDISTANLIGAAGSDYTVTAPKTLYARWNENEYTINYHNVDASDGVTWTSPYSPKTSRKYSEAVTLPIAANLSKNDGTNDYIFKGWWTLDGTTTGTWGTQVTEIAANTASLTGAHDFYAKWNPAWMVGFNMLGHGTAPNHITVENGTTIPSAKIPATPTATGYIFKGWFKTYNASAATFDEKYSDEWNFSTMNVTENMVLHAKWQPITYTIRYNSNGGTISKNSDTKTYDASLTLVTPTKTGHDFDGWFTDNDTFANPYNGSTNLSTTNGDTKDIYAKWTAHTYNISFNIGTVAATAPSPVSKTYGVARTTALPQPSNIPSGYEFLGWYKETTYNTEWTGLVASDDLTADNNVTIPVYAKWKRAIVFNVLYNGTSINATEPASQEITGATNITLPNTTATGYTFGGWYREAGLTNFVGMNEVSVSVDAPTTFYAKWTPITYKIYYKNVDGSSITDGEYVDKTYDSTVTLNNSPTKTGYTFGGWFTDNNTFANPYDGTDDLATAQGDDKNIYAKWTANEYSINYNLGGVSATAPAPITKTYGQALAANTLKNPTNIPTGYTFTGWYKEATYVNEWTGAANDDLTTGTTTQTIYARWKAKITYNQNGHGTAPAAVDVYLNDTTSLPKIDDVTGYTFDLNNSWYDDSDIATATFIGKAETNYTVTAPKTLYARWNENEYTITYYNVDSSDGVNWTNYFTPKTNRKYSEAVTLPVAANLSKNDGTNDYIFKGWWTLDGTTTGTWGTQVTEISANTVAPAGGHKFYAKWNAAWRIGFDMLGHGTAPSNFTAEQGTKVPSERTPANPTATGYIFKGWFKTYNASAATFDEKYSDEWNFSTMNVTENMVLHAKWQPITYTIRYNANGGTISKNSDTKTYDASLTLVEPTKTGHDFDGWFTDNDTFANPYNGSTNLSTTNGDTKDIYAKWTAHTYNISFNIGTVTATAPSPVSKTYGVARSEALPQPSNIPSGYEFLGWYKEATYNTEWTGLVAGDDLTTDNNVTIPVYAKWKRAIVFNVLYNGTSINATEPASQEITGATNITLPSTSATGYTFGGWYREAGLTNFVGMNGVSVAVDAPTTFYAKWTPKTYTINYNAKGGTLTGDTSFTKTYGTAITNGLVIPTKDGFTFGGWYTDDNTFNTPYNKANDTIYVEGTTSYTIFAKWTAKTYTINYNAKGGTITGSTSFTKTYGTAITTNLVTPTKKGYTFDGWFTDDNTFNNPYNKANDNIYVEGTTTYTIFAKWTAKSYTINYNAKGGSFTGSTSFTKTYDTAITTDLVTPTKTGYTFNGWFTDDNTFNTPYNKANDAIYVEGTTTYTIFAKWTENTYNIIYHNDNLSGVTYTANYTKPTSRKYTQEIILPTKNQISRNDGTREYKFDGWWTVDGSTLGNWGTKVEKIAANNTDTTAVHEFYAKWIPVWNVSFNMGGHGTAPATQHIDDKGKAARPTNKPSAEGKKFLGWYDSNSDTANEFSFNNEITSDTVIYAKWEDAVTIRFTFNMNGHGTQVDSTFVVEGESLSKPVDPTAEGYTFKYWYETDENTAFDFTNTIPATSEGNRTLIAKWDENSYKITLNTNEGRYINNFAAKTSRKYTESYTLPTADNIERPNFTFVGWFDNEKFEGTAITSIPAKTTSDKTYWLKWEEVKQETKNNSGSTGGTGGSGGSGGSGRSIAALPNAQQQQQQPNQTQAQTGPGNMPSTKLSIDTSSVNRVNATDNSTWNKDSSGNWHISITNEFGQSIEVKNAWCSIRSVKMVDNVPITVDDYYFLGSDGTMLTGWLTDANNKTYYLGTESWNMGRMARGWEKIGDKYYYFNNDGLLVTNSTTPDGYKLDATGAWIV